MTALEFIQLIQGIGVIGVLAFFTWGFYTGKIMPESVVQKILDRYSAEFRTMFEQILTEIKKKTGW